MEVELLPVAASLATSAVLTLILASASASSWSHMLLMALVPTLFACACLSTDSYCSFVREVAAACFHWSDPRQISKSTNAHIVEKSKKATASAREELSRGLSDELFEEARARAKAWSDASASEHVVSAATADKSAYYQVTESLCDHQISASESESVYLQDENSGLFLCVTRQRKLVMTASPDASCLFHIEKGKTHHWGFRSTISQRLIGQTFVGKPVVSAKKLQGWEAFRVLTPDVGSQKKGKTEEEEEEPQVSSPIYLLLCSARFGQGLWLSRTTDFLSQSSNSSTSWGGSNNGFSGSSSNILSSSMNNLLESSFSSDGSSPVYLSRSFSNALKLRYASDLSAFEAREEQQMTSEDVGLPSAKPTRTSAPVVFPRIGNTAFQPPILTQSKHSCVYIPWRPDPKSTKKFSQLPAKKMKQIFATSLTQWSVRDIVELMVDTEARRNAVAVSKKKKGILIPSVSTSSTDMDDATQLSESPVADSTSNHSGSTSQNESKNGREWHYHKRFGYVRRICYRPPTDMCKSTSAIVKNVNPVAMDVYTSCEVDEKNFRSMTVRSCVVLLGIPMANNVSVECVLDFQTGHGEPGMSEVDVQCRAGVVSPVRVDDELYKSAFEGVKNACNTMLGTFARGRGDSSSERKSLTGQKMLEVHPLPMEVAKSMLTALAKSYTRQELASSASLHFAKLPIGGISWNVYNGDGDMRRSSGSDRGGPIATSVPFFQCSKKEFVPVVTEKLNGKLSPWVVFQTLLSDESAMAQYAVGRKCTTNGHVDITSWMPYQKQVVKDDKMDLSELDDSRDRSYSSPETIGKIRKQTFCMSVKNSENVQVEDVQYCFLSTQDPDDEADTRLEFGMHIHVAGRESFAVEVLVTIEGERDPAMNCAANVLNVSCAIPMIGSSDMRQELRHSAMRGIHELWRQKIVTVLTEASESNAVLKIFSQRSVHHLSAAEQIRQKLLSEGQLPPHDELASKVLEEVVTTKGL